MNGANTKRIVELAIEIAESAELAPYGCVVEPDLIRDLRAAIKRLREEPEPAVCAVCHSRCWEDPATKCVGETLRQAWERLQK